MKLLATLFLPDDPDGWSDDDLANVVNAAKREFGTDIDFATEVVEAVMIGSYVAGNYYKQCETRDDIERVNSLEGWRAAVVIRFGFDATEWLGD